MLIGTTTNKMIIWESAPQCTSRRNVIKSHPCLWFRWKALANASGVPAVRADDLLCCVARGAGRALEEMEYRRVLHAV